MWLAPPAHFNRALAQIASLGGLRRRRRHQLPPAFYKNSSGGADFYIDGSKVATIASTDANFPSTTDAMYVMVNVNNTGSTFGAYVQCINWWT